MDPEKESCGISFTPKEKNYCFDEISLSSVVGLKTKDSFQPIIAKQALTPFSLGLNELSMNARSVPEVKAAIRKLSAAKCRNLAQKAMDRDDGDGVRQLLTNARNGSV